LLLVVVFYLYFLKNAKISLIIIYLAVSSVLCVTMDDRLMATGSLDRSIKLYQLTDGSLVQTLIGHQKGVWCVKFLTKFLLCSGSYDCSLKIWNIKSGVCNRTLFSHTGPIWGLCKQDGIMVSASQDKTAKVWDISGCNLIFTLSSHKEAVFCCDINQKTIATGSADKVSFGNFHLHVSFCFPNGFCVLATEDGQAMESARRRLLQNNLCK
jgi:WD40 repeat protein